VRDHRPGQRALRVARALPTGSSEETVPKTDAGIRTVDDLDSGLSLRLSAHATNLRPDDFLFGWLDHDGVSRPYRHENFYRRTFKPACRHLSLEIRFHDLRHFHASLLIDAGLTPVEVATRLGHTSPSFTLDTYAHLFRKESTGLGQFIATRRAEARGQSTGRHGSAAQRCASRRRGSGGSRTHPRGRRRTTVNPSAWRAVNDGQNASAGQRR